MFKNSRFWTKNHDFDQSNVILTKKMFFAPLKTATILYFSRLRRIAIKTGVSTKNQQWISELVIVIFFQMVHWMVN